MKHPTMNTTTHAKVQPPLKKHSTTTTTTIKPIPKPSTTTTATTTTTIKTTAATPEISPHPAKRYRPFPPPSHHHHRRHHQSKCCTCWCCFLSMLWITLIIIILLVLSAATATVFYTIYRPRPPTFTVPFLMITKLNLTSSDHFQSKFNITMTTKNPNDQITFYYDPINIQVITQNHQPETIILGQGSFPSFVHHGNNLTSLFAPLKNIDTSSPFDFLKSQWGHKYGLRLNVDVKIETKVSLKIGEKFKTNKVDLRALCNGILVNYAANHSKSSDDNGRVNKCKVELFITIFTREVTILHSS